MGKRSNFPRRERDFYPTPCAAVLPLIPWLREVRTFAEPCCGDGALVRHLESFGLRCVYAGDITTGQDALACNQYGGADCGITNPPYTRPLMHALIEHFTRNCRSGCYWNSTGHRPGRRRRSCPVLGHRDDRPRQRTTTPGAGLMPGIAAAPSSTGAIRAN